MTVVSCIIGKISQSIMSVVFVVFYCLLVHVVNAMLLLLSIANIRRTLALCPQFQ